jgi:Mobilization protein NikA
MKQTIRAVACYLTEPEADAMKRAAAACNLSLSRYLRQCLLHYQKLTTEQPALVSSAISIPLAETEQRLSRSIDTQSKRITKIHERLQILLGMVDRFALTALIHAPEVPTELREAAIASGNRRYHNWRRAVEELLQGGEPSALAASDDAVGNRADEQGESYEAEP